MKREKIFGALLLIAPLLIAVGFFLGNAGYWYAVDVVVLLMTGIIGLLLLLKSSQ